MIKPFYKSSLSTRFLETKELGVIDTAEMPIDITNGRPGRYEICWVTNGKELILSECGGRSSLDFGGRALTVVRQFD